MKTLARAAASAAVLLLTAGLASAETPVFIILREGGSFVEQTAALRAAGARIRHRVPPRIVIADLPDGVSASRLPAAENVYTSAVPVAALEPQGPAAVAAGLQWNRRVLAAAQSAGMGTFGFMRQAVADRSLPPPANLRVAGSGGRLVCEWDPVDGAVYYEIQAAGSAYFDGAMTKTSAVRPRVEIAAPVSGADVHVRVRAVDPGNPGLDDDVKGRWTSAVRASAGTAPAVGGSAPVGTSPADRLQTEGFTLILEWTPGAGDAQVQVARDADFTDLLFDEIASGGEYVCPGPVLQVGDRLHWRARTWAVTRSLWSDSREVRIGEPRAIPSDSMVNPEAPR